MHGYFGPKSMFWKIWRERVQLLGAPTSLILQLSHPLVAAGVGQYSNFQADSLGRLNRTVEIMLTIIFGTKTEANQALKSLNHVHQHVQGKIPKKMGIFKKGTIFNANDPQPKLWVYATLIDTGLKIHETFIEKLTNREKKKFYLESKLLAKLLGIPQKLLPKTLEDFYSYMQQMLRSEIITPTSESKQLVSFITHPNIPPFLKPLTPLTNLITAALLPEKLSKAYQLKFDKSARFKMEKLTKAIFLIIPLLPEQIRFMPQYYSQKVRLLR